MLLPSEYAAQLRECDDPAERPAIENALASSARRLLLRVINAICGPSAAAEAEDGAQSIVLDVVGRIIAGTVPPRYGEEDSYLQRCGRNEGRKILSGSGRRYQHRRFGPPAPNDEATEDPFGQERPLDDLDLRIAALKEVFPQLHDRYREVIEAHHFRGLQLKTIAEQWHRDGQAETLEKAVYVVQKAHQNAIKRLRVLIQERMREPSA